VNTLDLDGVGLDLSEGKKSFEIIDGISEDKLIFAGIVNGKNIWKNNYKNTLAIIEKTVRKNIVLSTSCSLLHVPYTLKNETKKNCG